MTQELAEHGADWNAGAAEAVGARQAQHTYFPPRACLELRERQLCAPCQSACLLVAGNTARVVSLRQ